MAIAAGLSLNAAVTRTTKEKKEKSMSQEFAEHALLLSFTNGLDRSALMPPREDPRHHHHVAQQMRRDKLRIPVFHPTHLPNPTHVDDEAAAAAVYEPAEMITDVFSFPHVPAEVSDQHFSSTAGMNADTATAMRQFLTNPQPMCPPSLNSLHITQPVIGVGGNIHPSQFTWIAHGENPIGPVVGESQALSLSLSSLEHAGDKYEGLRPLAAGDFLLNDGFSASCPPYSGREAVGYPTEFLSAFGMLKHSRYIKPARELLEEFCSVGRSSPSTKNNKYSRQCKRENSSNQSSSSSMDLSVLSTADKIGHQRRKVRLISMLDEVERRYSQYCEQLQSVVSSFDRAMGFGAAAPYTTLAHKAMSRHFRCLKDAIAVQLKYSFELLGEEGTAVAGGSGITRGETPRLKLLEQSLRQQRAFQQMGISDQEAWRPQRGLPERSVNILRAWLFEHFLHPYPSDADKHMLARQTGLSRNQVSNWFINARVRLWKPMVEEMYQQENKGEMEEEEEASGNNDSQQDISSSSGSGAIVAIAPISSDAAAAIGNSQFRTVDPYSDPSRIMEDTHYFHDDQSRAAATPTNASHLCPTTLNYRMCVDDERGGIVTASDYGNSGSFGVAGHGSTMITFGTATVGDVSLTLGLHHGGHRQDNCSFSDFSNG